MNEVKVNEVKVTIKDGRNLIYKTTTDYERVLNFLLTQTGSATEVMLARAALNAGANYKYECRGQSVTLAPVDGAHY